MFYSTQKFFRSLFPKQGCRRRTLRRYAGEVLESRLLPTVTATLSAAGALTLTGDDTAGTIITVDGDPATGDVVLLGSGNTMITFNGVTAVSHTLPFVNSISGTFGIEDDVVNLKDLTVGSINLNLGSAKGGDLNIDNVFANGVTVNMGDGNSFIGINNVRFGTTSLTIGTGPSPRIIIDQSIFVGALTITTGLGSDDVFIDNSGMGVQVLGALKIETSDGDDDINFGSVENNSVYGSISINSGSGDDDVGNVKGKVLGNLNITTGDGDDFIGFLGGSFGAVTINAGTGLNLIEAHLIAANSLSVTTGALKDQLFLNEMSITGATTINTGDGADELNLDFSGSERSHYAALTINLGNGDNTLTCHEEITTNALSITTGTGADTLDIDALSQGNWTINTGNGVDVLRMTGGSAGKLTVNTSGGGDVVAVVDQIVFKGNVTINTGTGDDNVTLEAKSGLLNQFGGTLNVNMGVENDNLLLNRSRVAGNTILIAEDVILNDDRFIGTFKATVKGNTGNPNISVEQTGGFTGQTVFEKDALFIVNAPTTSEIGLGLNSVNSKITFLGAAKFQGVVADPVDVRVLTTPTLRVFFNGSAPTFTNAVRGNV